MFILVVVAIVMTQEGPQVLTRPNVEYYQSRESCAQYGAKHIKEFVSDLKLEPAVLAAKCVKVGEMDGDPA